LSIDLDFSVEHKPRPSVAEHERINRLNGFTIDAYRDAAFEKLTKDLADSRPQGVCKRRRIAVTDPVGLGKSHSRSFRAGKRRGLLLRCRSDPFHESVFSSDLLKIEAAAKRWPIDFFCEHFDGL